MTPLKSLALALREHKSIRSAVRHLTDGLAATLQTPVALLSRQGDAWRFESESVPPGVSEGEVQPHAIKPRSSGSGSPIEGWTGVMIGRFHDREWVLLVPGTAEKWGATEGLNDFMDEVEETLHDVAARDRAAEAALRDRRAYAFGRRLSAASDPARVRHLILTTMASLVQATCGALAVYVEQEDHLSIVATVGYPTAIVQDLRIMPGAGVLGHAYQAGRPFIGRASNTMRKHRPRYSTDSYLVVPLKRGTTVLGLVALADREDGEAFTRQNLSDLRMLAPAAALALGRVMLQQRLDELSELAITDVVTGLFNRRYVESGLLIEIERARRQSHDLALLMIDIDNFKQVNDTLGHVAGDDVLRRIGAVLRRTVRVFDLCARYGGEEFLVLMPVANRAVAAGAAERIRRQIKSRCSREGLPVSASIGIGILEAGDTPEDLFLSADLGLLAAKASGKDTVRFGERPQARDSRPERWDRPALDVSSTG